MIYDNRTKRWILTYIPHKTKDEKRQVNPRIPLSKRALELIEKYKGRDSEGRLFPFISSDKYNEAIKRFFTVCGVTRNVVVRNAKTGESEIKPISELASSHMARRTFAGAAYKKVKDPNVVAKRTGHVEGSKAFCRYRDIDDDMLKEVIDMIE
jgi:integrase